MKRTALLTILGASLVVLSSGGSSRAETILDFSGLGLSNFDPIPGNYGSRAPGTPNVVVGYRSFDASTGATVFAHLGYWNTGYGDLVDVAYAFQQGLATEIILRPDPFFVVTLHSFDLAGFLGNRTASFLRIVDQAGNLLLDLGSDLPISGTSRTSFSPNFSRAGEIRLQFGTDWNIGIDNIRFSQSVIPEPASLLGCALGGALLGLVIASRRAIGVGMIRVRPTTPRPTEPPRAG